MACEDIEDQLNPLEDTEGCPVDGDGNFIPPPENDPVAAICDNRRDGLECFDESDLVNPAWELSENRDACIIDNYVNEVIQVGGAVLNIHKLLGVHEQNKLQDLTGNGIPISGGHHPNFPPKNAFDKYITEWRSKQFGDDVVKSAYIGYDFGEIRLNNGRLRYGIETFVKHDVSAIKIRQGCNSENRVTKARIERSNDGVKWYGVTKIDLPDCDGMVKINFKKSVPSRWWRIRPLQFNGGEEDYWSIQALQLVDREQTSLDNIEDRIFLENRNRDYDESAIRIKGTYIPADLQSFQSKFGFGSLFGGDEWIFEVNFTYIVNLLGRPFVIGDIIQLPSETQFSPSLEPILKYLEITDVAWSSNSFTPSWIPTMQRIVARPLMQSQESQDILGKLTPDQDETGLVDIDDGGTDKPYQDFSEITDTIEAEQNSQVPERGEDYAEVTELSEDVYDWAEDKGNRDLPKKIDRIRSQYGIDAMPPNGEPYTQGDDFPQNPSDGDYHRKTYTNIRTGIPARLYRFSGAKKRWIFLETDRRAEFRNTRPKLQEFLDEETSSKTDPDEVYKDGDTT